MPSELPRKPPRRGSLTRKTLLHVAIGVTCVIGISSTLTYRLMYEEMQTRARERLREYVQARAQVESTVFVLARDTQQVIRQAVIRDYRRTVAPGTEERFDSLFLRYPDGSVRSRPERFGGPEAVTGWIRSGTPVTPELKQRVLLFNDILEQFKPSSMLRFSDIFFTAPEQLNIGTDPPGLPLWAKVVAADFDQNAEIWERQASTLHNPRRETFWIRVALEPVWHKFLAGVGTPIDKDGVHIGTIYNDLLLDELVQNLLRNGLPGAKQCVFQSDGYLIAHTDRMGDITAAEGKYTIQQSGDETLRALLRAVADGPALPFSSYDAASDHHFAISRIDGPGWYFASTISGEVMRSQAFRAARWVLWAGLASLAVLVAVLAGILRRQIALPLGRLNRAVEQIAAGEVNVHLREHPHDEIGRLTRGFNDMAQKIAERDAALRQEKQDLEAALEQLQRQRETLHQRDRLAAMGSLLAGVAHELNNPLAVVVGRSIMLEETATDARVRTGVQKIRIAAERCARIVKTFLAMARQREQKRTRVRLESVIDAALDVLDYSLRSTGVQVVREFAPDVPELDADEDQLHQVFMNLFVNAQQAMAEAAGARRLRITGQLTPDAGSVTIAVSDTGPGIDPTIRARIFDPYFTTKPMGTGTGVGLSVSLGIVEAHRGTLVERSTLGAGACFILTLPVPGRESAASSASLPGDSALPPHAPS